MSIDLGIAGRTALVRAASKGLGRACAEALAQAGAIVAHGSALPGGGAPVEPGA